MLQRETCEKGKVEESFGKREKEKRNSQGKEPRTFDENSQGGDLSTVKQTARERPKNLQRTS